jgi:hypothetical protein
VSTDGGTQPMWRADGKELYFIGPDGSMYASAVVAGPDTLAVNPPMKLFQTRIEGGGALGSNREQYAVSRDGRFLINEVMDAVVSPITIIANAKF